MIYTELPSPTTPLRPPAAPSLSSPSTTPPSTALPPLAAAVVSSHPFLLHVQLFLVLHLLLEHLSRCCGLRWGSGLASTLSLLRCLRSTRLDSRTRRTWTGEWWCALSNSESSGLAALF